MSGSAPEAEWAPGYTAAALLRQGRRARIIRATRVTSGAEVVLKVLPPDAGQSEVRHLQSLDGVPGAVPLLDAGTASDGAFFVVLPFYPDGSFGEMLAKKGPAPIQEAAAVSRSIAAALGALHARGLVHDDICPGNVLRAGRTPVLTGFGSVHRAGEALPPPPPSMESFLHSPPEALRGEPRTPSSDVYLLASTVWTMLVGRAPFAATDGRPFDPAHYANRVLHDEPDAVRRNDVSRSLRRVLTRALSKNPEDRYATPADFATAFERARTGRAAVSPSADGGPPAEQFPEAAPAGPQAPPTVGPSGPQVPPVPPSGTRWTHRPASSGPQPPHGSVPTGPQAPGPSVPSGPQAPHWTGPSGPQRPPQHDASGPQAPHGAPPSSPVAPQPGHPSEDDRTAPSRGTEPPAQEPPPERGTPGEPHSFDPAQRGGLSDTELPSDTPRSDEHPTVGPRPRALPTPEERERQGAVPEEVANGTADLMMARLRGEEISPLRAWSRLEGWRGNSESSYLPVEEGQGKDKDAWEPLDVTPDRLPRWRRQMHIAVAVCGTLVVTMIASAFAATNASGPMTAAAENSDSEEADGSAEEEQTTTEAEPIEPSPPPEVAEPSGVALEDTSSAVTLRWADNSGGTADYFVLGGLQGQQPVTMARTGPGAETAQVNTPNTSTEYCFTVIAVEGAASPADEVCTTRAADRAEAERQAEEEAEEDAEEEDEEGEPSPSPSPSASDD